MVKRVVETEVRANVGPYVAGMEKASGGEAYIPLAESKRPRSEAILQEVASRFGYALARRADGSVDVPGYQRPAPVATVAPAPGATIYNQTFQVEGREALQLLLDQTRHATRIGYQTNGVHR